MRFLLAFFLAAWAALPAGAVPADTASRGRFAFLLPAEGDVLYERDVKVVGQLAGPLPEGAFAELDGFAAGASLAIEKDIVTFSLSGLEEGVHVLRLAYRDARGKKHVTVAVRFFVRLPEPPPAPPPPKLKQFGRVTLRTEWKNDEAASRVLTQAELVGLGEVPETDSTWAYDTLVAGRAAPLPSRNLDASAEVSYGARYGRWEADAKGLVSTGENRFRQPVNRLSASVAYGPWAYARAGDVYPDYHPLIFNGTRLRGAEAGAAVVRGEEPVRWGSLKAATGETQRRVPAYVVRSGQGAAIDTAYLPGTRAQRVHAVRLAAGGGEAFEFGATLMKAVEIREDSLSESLNDYLYGAPPSENLVGGLDARAGFWDGRLQAYGQAALSLYTRDRTLGPFSPDTASAFRPGRYRRVLIVNPTTQGWEYLVTDGGEPDYAGFADAASAYVAGASASLPLGWGVWETDLSYKHLGSAYRSETNPFLGGNPGDGWVLQQRLGFMENRLRLGAEASTFLQSFAEYRQRERGGKAEARFTTEEEASSVWLSGSVSRLVPEGDVSQGYSQDFDEFNVGGSHRAVAGPGTANLYGQYGFTRAGFRLHDPDPATPRYPVSFTHALNSSVLYKFRDSEFMPKASHAWSDNGVQKPVHTFGVGFQNTWLDRKLKLDANVLAGEYARSETRNGPAFAQNAALTVRFEERQSLRLSEKSSHRGERVSVIAGAHYERSF
ncbi:MAG: hypothetical protein K0Q91_2198 [Fibrobacteria bacterium]|jgi:hypothetical protein|nr:hypothetical protein [Fibrobacteria bacterium]